LEKNLQDSSLELKASEFVSAAGSVAVNSKDLGSENEKDVFKEPMPRKTSEVLNHNDPMLQSPLVGGALSQRNH
jgi:hypothetical protein